MAPFTESWPVFCWEERWTLKGFGRGKGRMWRATKQMKRGGEWRAEKCLVRKRKRERGERLKEKSRRGSGECEEERGIVEACGKAGSATIYANKTFGGSRGWWWCKKCQHSCGIVLNSRPHNRPVWHESYVNWARQSCLIFDPLLLLSFRNLWSYFSLVITKKSDKGPSIDRPSVFILEVFIHLSKNSQLHYFLLDTIKYSLNLFLQQLILASVDSKNKERSSRCIQALFVSMPFWRLQKITKDLKITECLFLRDKRVSRRSLNRDVVQVRRGLRPEFDQHLLEGNSHPRWIWRREQKEEKKTWNSSRKWSLFAPWNYFSLSCISRACFS